MTVASGADFNGSYGSVAEATHAAPDRPHGGVSGTPSGAAGEVTITVTGQMAADMIGRGETERRAREALACELREKLHAVEAALARKAAEQQLLEQSVQELRGQLGRLGMQTGDHVSHLRAELARTRSDLVQAGDGFGNLDAKLDRLEGTVGGLSGALADLEGRIGSLGLKVADIDGRLPPPGERPRLLPHWGKGLHFWSAVAAVAALTATAGAIWLYA